MLAMVFLLTCLAILEVIVEPCRRMQAYFQVLTVFLILGALLLVEVEALTIVAAIVYSSVGLVVVVMGAALGLGRRGRGGLASKVGAAPLALLALFFLPSLLVGFGPQNLGMDMAYLDLYDKGSKGWASSTSMVHFVFFRTGALEAIWLNVYLFLGTIVGLALSKVIALGRSGQARQPRQQSMWKRVHRRRTTSSLV